MSQNNKKSAFSLDLKKYIWACIHSWKIFALCCLGCAAMAVFYALYKTPTVEVQSQLMLRDDVGGGGSFMLGELARSFSMGDMFGGSSSTDNEASIISSHTVMYNTAKDLDLNVMYHTKRYGFRLTPMQDSSPLKLILPDEMADTLTLPVVFNTTRNDNGKYDVEVKLKRTVIAKATDQPLPIQITTDLGPFTIDKSEYYDENENTKFVRITAMSYAAAAYTYSKLVKVIVPDRKTDFIMLTYMAANPKFGIKLLDTIIKNYTDIVNEYKVERSEQSLALVNKRLASLMDELSVSEEAIEHFKKANNITNVEVDAQYLMTKNGNVESSLIEAQAASEVLKMTKDFISNPANNYSLIPELMASSPDNPSQISQYNQLILQRMQLLTSAKATSPVVVQLDEQIDAMRKIIIASVDRSYENSLVLLNDLKKENTKNQSRIGSLPAIERQYIVLKRDNMLQEQMYLFLLQQREELQMSLATRSMPAQVIDAPHAILKPALSKAFMAILGFVLGGLIAAVWVFLLKMDGEPLRSRSEFSNIVNAPVLGSLKSRKKGSPELTDDSDTDTAEALRTLRSDIQAALKNCGGNTVVVTSMHPGEGKTYVAVNLAAVMAKLGKKVLLVDASLRNPGVADVLGIANPAPALAAYVEGNASDVETNAVAVGGSCQIDVVTAAQSSANASDILGSEKVAELIERLKREYDYVVVDASPILGYSDMTYLTALADITLIVCRAGYVSGKDVDAINAYQEEGRYKRIAVVDNTF